VEERLGRHGEFGRASFSRLSLGKQAPLVLAVKGIPFAGDLAEGGALAMALDIQVEWDGQPDILIQLSGIPGASVAVQLCHVKGLLRVELSPIEDELPFLTGLSLTLLSNPELDFDIRRVQGGRAAHRACSPSWGGCFALGYGQAGGWHRRARGADAAPCPCIERLGRYL
jgi:hypothetical protein